MELALETGLHVSDLTPANGHERLLHATDDTTGLNALISVHSTKRGPAAGGCRMFAYASFDQAIEDVERLSRGMTYKNAAADLPLGGGKSVIIGSPDQIKSPDLMRSFGAFVDSLKGQYYTAEDVGISPQDLAYAAERSRYVVGLDGGAFGSGDPSPHTAQGVFRAMNVTWNHLTHAETLDGVTVAIQGLGHVGMHLAGQLYKAGANLIVADLDQARTEKARAYFKATIVSVDDIIAQKADIFAPCAMGSALNPETVSRLKVRAVVGAANNQLASDAIGQFLKDHGITYAPDYLVNGAGVTNAAMEILKISDPHFCQERLEGLANLLSEVLKISDVTGELPHKIADRLVEGRFAAD